MKIDKKFESTFCLILTLCHAENMFPFSLIEFIIRIKGIKQLLKKIYSCKFSQIISIRTIPLHIHTLLNNMRSIIHISAHAWFEQRSLSNVV